MTAAIPLDDIPFPPRTAEEVTVAAAALPAAIHSSAKIAVSVVSDPRVGPAFEFVRSLEPQGSHRVIHQLILCDGPLRVPTKPADGDLRRGWKGWVSDLQEVAHQVRAFHGTLKALFVKCEDWLSELKPAPTLEKTDHEFYDQFDLSRRGPSLIDRAAYTAPGLAATVQGETMGVMPAARRVIGGGSSARLIGGDGPFVLHHPAEADTVQWSWHNDRPPYEVVPLDEPRFLELARACLYLDEPVLQPA